MMGIAKPPHKRTQPARLALVCDCGATAHISLTLTTGGAIVAGLVCPACEAEYSIDIRRTTAEVSPRALAHTQAATMPAQRRSTGRR